MSRVVEVGIGPGFLSAVLGRLGVHTIGVDIDRGLKPEIVGALPSLPLGGGVVPLVVCFQTLEHLPLEQLGPALGELARVSARDLIISVPDNLLGVRGRLRAWWARLRMRRAHRPPLPSRGRRRAGKSAGHWWEIGEGASVAHIAAEARKAGLDLLREFRPPHNAYHHFFVFRKAGV